MRVVDASSIVLAWDTYPIDQFPPFWEWIDSTIQSAKMVMAEPNFDEVGHVSPELQSWLLPRLTRLPVDNKVMVRALQINTVLGTTNDNYHPDGVDENDILCIATAQSNNCGLLADESPQPALPQNMRRYKIPAVCNLGKVAVSCLNLNQYIRQSGVVFN
ncbi:hypothetical protein AB833_20480 [Chromatiales bacterium (ex Bugula neritina AB1)]|nr:hypothetical protein AB833_20480 [Chromatiales bacterium (ex Bugula neritina AB1)]